MITNEQMEAYKTLESKTRCTTCGNNFCLAEEGGVAVLRCVGIEQCPNTICQTSVITWDDLAEAVSKVSSITDLYLDFLWKVIDRIEVDGYRIEVTVEPISEERKSELLRLQDYWLVHHSMLGDERAEEIIYIIHAPLVKKRLAFMGRKSLLNARDLEDLEQAIWLRIFRHLSTYNSNYRLWTWMKLVIRTEFHMMYIRKNKEMSMDDVVRIQHETREIYKKSNIERWLDKEYIAELLSVLNARERYVVVEHLIKGRQQKDISVDLHICRQRTHQLYYKALRKMREYELSERLG